jgi:hypothetical protein
MTAHTLSPEQIARLPCCAEVVAAKGAVSAYAADCLVRTYQGRHVSDLCRDAGMPCDETTIITIMAGIGTLRMAWTGNHFVPAVGGQGSPQGGAASSLKEAMPLPAAPAVRDERIAVCIRCQHLVSGRCSVAGCACAGLGQPKNRFSRCPVGKW